MSHRPANALDHGEAGSGTVADGERRQQAALAGQDPLVARFGFIDRRIERPGRRR
jgi:hypothetical protein